VAAANPVADVGKGALLYIGLQDFSVGAEELAPYDPLVGLPIDSVYLREIG
jgi:hypothetical protein